MDTVLLIEQGALKKNVAAAKMFEKKIKNLGDGNIFSIMKDVHAKFPDSNFNGFRVMIAVPTAQKLCTPESSKLAMRLLSGAFKELGWL